LGETKEEEESVYEFGVDFGFVLVHYVLSGDLQLVDQLVTADRSDPLLEGFSELLLVYLQLLLMENLPLAVHNLQLSVLLFYDQGQLRGKVPPLRPGSKELLIVLFLAAAADIERVVMTQRRSSRCEIIVLCLHCSTMTALGCGLELLAMYEIDVVGTLHGEFILVFQQTAEESFFDYGMQDLIDLLLFLDVLGLLQFALGQLLVRGVVVHGDALGIGRVDLALLLSLSNFHIN
jgi:hypothetical protein